MGRVALSAGSGSIADFAEAITPLAAHTLGVNSERYLNRGSIIMTVVLGGLIALRNVRRGPGTAGPVQRVAAGAEDT